MSLLAFLSLKSLAILLQVQLLLLSYLYCYNYCYIVVSKGGGHVPPEPPPLDPPLLCISALSVWKCAVLGSSWCSI